MKSWGKPSGGWDGDPEGGGRHEREDFWACESTAASSPVAGVGGLDKPSNPHGLCGLERETGDRALGDGGARGRGALCLCMYSTVLPYNPLACHPLTCQASPGERDAEKEEGEEKKKTGQIIGNYTTLSKLYCILLCRTK